MFNSRTLPELYKIIHTSARPNGDATRRSSSSKIPQKQSAIISELSATNAFFPTVICLVRSNCGAVWERASPVGTQKFRLE
jgi:hypothetical protein